MSSPLTMRGRYLLLLAGVPKQRMRNDREAGLRAERRRKRRRLADGLADDDRGGLVEADAAERPRARRRQAGPARRARATSVARQRPVLLLEFAAPAPLRWSTNSAAVCAISRCSSLRRSGVKTSRVGVAISQSAPRRGEVIGCHVGYDRSREAETEVAGIPPFLSSTPLRLSCEPSTLAPGILRTLHPRCASIPAAPIPPPTHSVTRP